MSDLLLSYQREFLSVPRYNEKTGRAQVRTLLKARRIGGSYAAAIDAVAMATGVDIATGLASEPLPVFVVSATLRQSKSLVDECAGIARKFARLSPRFEHKAKRTEIHFTKTDRRIIGLASNPDGIRGATGAVIVDECCFIQNFEELWQAVKPISMPNLRDARGYPVTLITTPYEAGTLQHELFTDKRYPFIRHQVDIYDAVKAGFPIDPAAVLEEVGLQEIFDLEYACKWRSGGTIFFPSQLILNCYDEHPPKELADAPRYWGIDVGRTHDLSVAMELAYHGNTLWVMGIHTWRGVPIQDQAAMMTNVIAGSSTAKIRVDRGLMGVAIVDHLKERFGSLVHGVDLTADVQESSLVNVKHMMERGRLRFNTSRVEPGQIRALTMELGSLKTKPGTGARTRFDTPREAGGHCDRAWALAIGAGEFRATRPSQEGMAKVWGGNWEDADDQGVTPGALPTPLAYVLNASRYLTAGNYEPYGIRDVTTKARAEDLHGHTGATRAA